jgi:predicted transcriptional regulator
MELLIGLGIAVLAVIVGFILTPYLKNKGILTEENVLVTKQVLEISKLIAKNLEYKDDSKETVIMILEISDAAVRYVEQTAGMERRNDAKKDMAVKSVLQTLKLMKVNVTDDVMKLVELGVESAVNSLPKTYK